ncbi:MAG TPA: glycosyltransferase [Pyrinomonadaceae bacterium]
MTLEQRLIVVIPTRNRAQLTMNAIRSVLAQEESAALVLVSDNSTDPAQLETLARFCHELDDARVRYARPPRSLNMPEHWDWAMEQALQSDATHFTILTDRMVFKAGQLKTVGQIAARYPERIICYLHDRVVDLSAPYRVEHHAWTGKLYEVAATRLLTLSAESVMYDGCTPRMLNCLVPRGIFDAIKERFGTIFSSISPDWNFCYRALEVVDSILFFNKAVLVHYALYESNGQSGHTGIKNRANEDFLKTLRKPLNSDAPFPEIMTVWNAIISEYCCTRQETRSAKFPELNMEKYLQALAVGIARIEDPELRREMERKLSARGGNPADASAETRARKLLSPRRAFNKLKGAMGWTSEPVFETPDQALAHAVNNFPPRSARLPFDEAIHQGRELPLDGVHQA